MTLLRVTLDTGVVNERELPRITAACQGRDVDIAHTTVTEREQKGTGYASAPGEVMEEFVWDESPWDGALWGTTRIYETYVVGESPVGSAKIGSDDDRSMFHAILDVIGDRSFPARGKRGELTRGQQPNCGMR